PSLFFFQAEDGIRDRNVTGVQTCALPICKALISTDLPSKELGQFADLALKSRHTKIATLSLVPPDVNVADPDFDQIRKTISRAKIGRASCRERVQSTVVAGALNSTELARR